MPPVSPGQPSSFGSIFADSPGLLRENGYTFQFNLATSAVGGMAICSGTFSDENIQYQSVLAPLGPGDALHIYGIQGSCGSADDPMLVGLKTGAWDDDVTNPLLTVLSANRHGPWFQGFELPITIDGPAAGTLDVYLSILSVGAIGLHVYNNVTLELLVYRKR